jgi:uncharacterized protein YcbK (DUF882 family)
VVHGRHGLEHGHAAWRRHAGHLPTADASQAPVPAADLGPILGDEPRRLKLLNLHTAEALEAVYWEDGRYVPDALHAVNHVLRDFRTGETHPMDPQVLDLLVALRRRVESKAPFHIISGYRSPRTNALLRAEGGAETGVAKKSLHLQGQAIDLRLADVDLSHVHAAALSLGRGGVGYYPVSNFVHVDVGRVRRWDGV